MGVFISRPNNTGPWEGATCVLCVVSAAFELAGVFKHGLYTTAINDRGSAIKARVHPLGSSGRRRWSRTKQGKISRTPLQAESGGSILFAVVSKMGRNYAVIVGHAVDLQLSTWLFRVLLPSTWHCWIGAFVPSLSRALTTL